MRIAAGIVALLLAAPAYANPDGAPWGAADPEAEETCSSCHFDNEVVRDSTAISISFKDRAYKYDQPTELYINFINPQNKQAGMQIIASAGKFISEWDDIETNGAQARSIRPRDNSSWPELSGLDFITKAVMWKIKWNPPESSDGDIYFLIAVNESNDDQSSFGDIIHYYSYTIQRPGAFWKIPEH